MRRAEDVDKRVRAEIEAELGLTSDVDPDRYMDVALDAIRELKGLAPQ